ncbi:MAG: CheR family methyltransferase [Thermoanaerobaculia bacterium]
MSDRDCVRFLHWALPRMGFRWPGFRKVRRQVCRRIARRLHELELADLEAYRRHLESHPAEWSRLDRLCRVTISRFCRDRGVFEALGRTVLPALAERSQSRGEDRVRVWSAGCGAGEELYSVALVWRQAATDVDTSLELELVGTDTDEHQLERARQAVYPESCLRELPEGWVGDSFTREPSGELRLGSDYRRSVRLTRQDLRHEAPPGLFHLILCRNLAFTYFDHQFQGQVLTRLFSKLVPGGALVLGSHETLPAGDWGLVPWDDAGCILQKISS